jgi:hypothetical protein
MANDAGLYGLASDLGSLTAANQAITLDSTKRALTGATLTAGIIEDVPAANYIAWMFTAGSRSGGSAAANISTALLDNTNSDYFPNHLGTYNQCPDATTAFTGAFPGGGVLRLPVATDIAMKTVAVSSGTFTLAAKYTGVCLIRLDTPPIAFGLYNRATDQTSIDTAAEQIVIDQTVYACTGVSPSAGSFTFGSSGLYVVAFGGRMTRTAGAAGSTVNARWTTTPAGTPATYSAGIMTQWVTNDATTTFGSHGPAIAIVDASGGDVTLGLNVEAITGASAAFTLVGAESQVTVIRLI